MSIYLHIYYKDPEKDNELHPLSGQMSFRKWWLMQDNPMGFEILQLIFNHGMDILPDSVLLPLIVEVTKLKAFYTDSPPPDMSTSEINSLIRQINFLMQKLEYVRDHPDNIAEAWMG